MKNRYKILSKRYLSAAKRLIKRGNYLQASEKLWGAAAQIVKAYAEENNLKHDGHRELFIIVDRLSEKLKDEELISLFHIASALHINFYENWLTKREVKIAAKDVKKFIDKVEKILP